MQQVYDYKKNLKIQTIDVKSRDNYKSGVSKNQLDASCDHHNDSKIEISPLVWQSQVSSPHDKDGRSGLNSMSKMKNKMNSRQTSFGDSVFKDENIPLRIS